MVETSKFLYKILTEKEYTYLHNHRAEDTFSKWAGTAFDISDGFIHLCVREQVPNVLTNHYSAAECVFIFLVETSKLNKNALKWEAADQQIEKYPHLYDTLDLTNLRSVKIYKHEFKDFFSTGEI